MRIIFVSVLMFLSLASQNASAEWTIAGGNDGFVQYVDLATIRRSGNIVKMWDLTDYKKAKTSAAGKSYQSSKNQIEYDCKEERLRFLAFIWFSGQMGNGAVVYSDSDAGKWSPVAPGSVSETLWKIACGKM